jgi:hypothetical protein
MSAGARVRALVGDACHSDLARRKAAFWRALCIVGPGSAVGQPAALVWRRARHSRRWQSVCCTIHTSCRPAALGSDQSCLAMAYMCVSLDVRCTKINLQTGRRTGWSHAGTPGTATPTPHASPVIHNVVIHVAPFRARGPAAPEPPTHPIRRAQALSSTIGPHTHRIANEFIDSLILLTVRGRVSGLLT